MACALFVRLYRFVVKLLLENLPESLALERDTLARCLEAMNRALPFVEVYLFGSHARGDAHPESDVDLCVIAEGADEQLATAQKYSRSIRSIRPKPAFTLVPITPRRLQEKRKIKDFFFETVMREGVRLASAN
jgi:uncharacterized protein